MKLIRKKSNASQVVKNQVVANDDKPDISDEFKSKLNLLLGSPQGKEIQKRNWRVSDKFRGGKPIERKNSRQESQERMETKSSGSGSTLNRHKSSFGMVDRDRNEEDIFEQFASKSKNGSQKSKSSRSYRKELKRQQKKFDHLL